MSLCWCPASAQESSAEYRLYDVGSLNFLPTLDDSSERYVSFKINSKGQVALLRRDDQTAEFQAWVWLPSPDSEYGLHQGLHCLTPPVELGHPSAAFDISDHGLVVGQAGGVGNYTGQGVVWDLAQAVPDNCLIASPALLGTLGTSDWSRGIAVNNTVPATILGLSGGLSSCEPCPSDSEDESTVRSFRVFWDAEPLPVPLLPSCDPASFGRGLNDAGTPVGQSKSVLESGPCQMTNCVSDHDAVAWSDAMDQSAAIPMMDIGTMQQPRDSDCRAINNVGAGQVVGWGFTGEDQFDCNQHALLWNSPFATEVPQDLGAGLTYESRAEGLNNATPHPLVVGLNVDLQRALIWEHDGGSWTASELDDRVGCAGQDIRLSEAHDVNDEGWIVAWGVDDSQSGDEAYHLYVLAPYDSLTCAADIDGSGTVDVIDLLAVNVGWTGDDLCDSVVGCLADTNGDCIVNVVDLIDVVNNWGCCPGSSEPAPASLQTEIEHAGLLYPQDWNYFMAHVDEHTFRCWMEHYLMDCNPCLGHNCGGPDPYSPNRH